jgi:tRNA(adenine34) deaminase
LSEQDWMRAALAAAGEGAAVGDVPVGAVVIHDGAVLVRASNRTVRDQDPTAHAELLAIREASRLLGRWRLDDCTLVVTLEPCAMCAGAIVLARVGRMVYGATDPKAGACGSVLDVIHEPRLNHRVELTNGVLAEQCGGLLKTFFQSKRRKPEPESA